ncbi:MAG TPA: hypothetical protein VFO29_11320 [Candidatus Rubrimentiphilum sp.]|nr:hypothetical protein [Candidatus Rubrimentiphilum sp.]
MSHDLPTRFGRFGELLLVAAVALGLINQFAFHGQVEWITFVSIALSITALFVYGITYGMRLSR